MTTLSATAAEFVMPAFTVSSGEAAPLRTFAEPAAPPAGDAPFLLVIDPLSRKLMVPFDIISPTRAVARVGTPSLCMLYLSGRCRQGAQCHQVHADPITIMRLREEAKNVPTCCVAHNDANAAQMQSEWLTRRVDVNGVIIPAGRLAFTVGLGKLFSESKLAAVRVATQQVCRLHVSDRCRYSEDCKFIHICREEVETKLAAWVQPMAQQSRQPRSAAMLAPAAPAAASPHPAQKTLSPNGTPTLAQSFMSESSWAPTPGTATPPGAHTAHPMPAMMMVPHLVPLPTSSAAAGVPVGTQYVMMVPVPAPLSTAPSFLGQSTLGHSTLGHSTLGQSSFEEDALSPRPQEPLPESANRDDDVYLGHLLPSSILDECM